MTDPLAVTVRIQARLLPEHRDALLAGPVTEQMTRLFPGIELAANETVVGQDGEPLEAVLGYRVDPADAEQAISALFSMGEGLPRGSAIEVGEARASFGNLDGVGLYLDSARLADERYSGDDLAAAITGLQAAVEEVGAMWSFWQGPVEAGIYFYGPDAAAIRAALEPRCAAEVLLAGSRLVMLGAGS